MPGLDGTGPAGQGPMTGRGLGNCTRYQIIRIIKEIPPQKDGECPKEQEIELKPVPKNGVGKEIIITA